MPPIRLVAVDLDGTLLRHDKTIHPASGRALQRADAAGLTVVFASGRMAEGIRPYARELGIVGPIVSSNGAYVIDADGNSLQGFWLDADVREAVLDYVEAENLHLNLYALDTILYSKDDDWGRIYQDRVKGIHPEVVGIPALRGIACNKLLITDTPERVQRHRERLAALLPLDRVNIVLSEPEYIEFLPSGVHKGMGLEAVCRHLGVVAEEVAAIGDYLNDLEMVQWAGFGGAVANAAPEVQAAAKQVFASNEEGGVAEFVDAVLALSVGKP